MKSPRRRGLAALHVLFAIAACGGCEYTELPGIRNVHTVEPGVLVRGAQPDEAGFRALRRELGVATVVNFNDGPPRREGPIVTRLGMAYAAIPADPFRPRT